jgi:cytochrome P450
MLNCDGMAHDRLRGLVGAAFTRRRIENLIPRIEQITRDLLEGLDTTAVTDLIAGFAYPLPMTVICEMIGVPEQDRDEFRHGYIVTSKGPPFVSDDDYIAATEAVVGLIRRLVAARRAHPSNDLLSQLITLRQDRDQLSDDELTSMINLLVLAGHETTVNLIANGIHALLTHPDQLARLRGKPHLIAPAVEELLRFESPVHLALPLTAAEPLDINGVEIAAGQIVIAALLAANRDPARIPQPDRLDIARAHNPHMAFGHGIHHCLGAPLARLEGRIALTSLLDRYPRLRLAVAPERLTYQPSFVFHALATLPVMLT